VLFPVALVAAKQWRAVVSAAITAALLAGASMTAFGVEVWSAFPRQLLAQTELNLLGDADGNWGYLQSVYGVGRTWYGSASWAGVAQTLTTLAAAVAVWVVWRSRTRFSLKAALLSAAALIASPYAFMYDMAALMIPAAFLARDQIASGATRAEALIGLGLFATTVALLFIFRDEPGNATFGSTPVGILTALVLMAVILWRIARRDKQVPLSALQGGREGPNAQRWEGEVGGVANRCVGPPHPTLVPRPAGGEGVDKASGRRGAPLAARLLPPWPAEIGLAVVVVLAILLRLQPILAQPSAVWPDEIFQTAEPAHRLVFGNGLVPWEFQLGVRSWLLPGIIAGLMEGSRALGDGPDYYLPVIAVAFAGLAAAPVVCCFLWCRPLFGGTGALLAALAVAVAAEPVYFGGRTLSETVAGHLLVLALWVLEPGYPVVSRRRLFIGGALLGLVGVIRVQLAPALAVALLWTHWGADCRRVAASLAGMAAILAAAGILDALTLGYPFASLWRYVLYNTWYGVSSTFGVEPWPYFLLGELGVWGGAAATMLLLAAIGAWRLPLLLAVAAVVLAIHSGIAHKEYRFIYPVVMLLAVLAAVGLAQIASWGREWLAGRGFSQTTAALVSATMAVAWWGAASLQVWAGAALAGHRERMHDSLVAASTVAHGPPPCGIGLYGLGGEDWGVYGGYTYFHRSAPMYWPKDEAALATAADAFYTLLYTKPPPAALGFATQQCIGEVCLARRSGSCRSAPMEPLPFPKPLMQLARG
jgi:phosphatidylinositol glycan class B